MSHALFQSWRYVIFLTLRVSLIVHMLTKFASTFRVHSVLHMLFSKIPEIVGRWAAVTVNTVCHKILDYPEKLVSTGYRMLTWAWARCCNRCMKKSLCWYCPMLNVADINPAVNDIVTAKSKTGDSRLSKSRFFSRSEINKKITFSHS